MAQWNELPRPNEVWVALRSLLASANMVSLLGGQRIYLPQDSYNEPEGPSDEDWARLVIQPGQALWPEVSNAPGETRQVACLLRGEVNQPAPDYNPAVKLEAIQAEAYTLLRGWAPSPFAHVMVAFPFWQESPPQLSPQWDEGRQLWWLSSHWRAEILAAP